MTLNLKSREPGRNDPCPCGSELKYKKCHGDPVKRMICNRVANEHMVSLIRVEQRKKIIAKQQAECKLCGHTGTVPGEPDVARDVKCTCQFLTDEEFNAYRYKIISENLTEENTVSRFRSFLIRCAAICCAAIETIDRNSGKLVHRHYDN